MDIEITEGDGVKIIVLPGKAVLVGKSDLISGNLPKWKRKLAKLILRILA